MKRSIILLTMVGLYGPAMGQSFQCRIGQDAACLDWGESVCSSGGKCVAESAECFESHQCDYKGFACKSDVDQCVEAHDKIARDYNSLISDYDTLHTAGQELAESYDALQRDFEELQREVRDLEDAHDELQSCLTLAQTVAATKLCAY